jgi:hypothetical protein
VTITDANGCSTNASLTLTEPAVLANTLTASVYAGGYNISCNGYNDGSISNAVSGGTQPYTYSWSNGSTTQDVGTLTAGSYSVTVTDANGCSTTASLTLTEPAVLANTLTASVYAGGYNISCNGYNDGSISNSVSGGTQPYAYNWSNGSTTQDVGTLTAGSYSVTITDANGCTKISSITLTQPNLLTNTLTSPVLNGGFNLTCNGGSNGSVSNAVIGGTQPYAYSWSNGSTTQNISNLTAGSYTLTITDANGCTRISSITLTQPTPIVVTVTKSNYNGVNISCNGGSNGVITVTGTGGISPYTYSLNGGAYQVSNVFSNLTAGNYNVTVRDVNNCTTTLNVVMTQPAAPLAATVTVNPSPTIPNGSANTIYLGYGPQSVTLVTAVTGGTGNKTYVWAPAASLNNPTAASPIASPTVTTTYTVTITDINGCSITKTVSICVINAVSSTNPGKFEVCQVPPGNPNNKKTITVSPNAIAAHMSSGSCLGSCVTGSGGQLECQSTTACSNNPGGRVNTSGTAEVESFPNPFRETATIRFTLPETEQVVLTVFNSSGAPIEILLDKRVEGGITQTVEFNGAGLSDGIYVYQLRTTGEVFTGKMVLIK